MKISKNKHAALEGLLTFFADPFQFESLFCVVLLQASVVITREFEVNCR